MDIAAVDAIADASLLAECSLQAELSTERFDALKQRFLSKRISPTPRTVLSGPTSTETKVVYFLTDCDPQSVIFDPVAAEFGVAWGPEAESGTYFDEGQKDKSVLLMEFLCEWA